MATLIERNTIPDVLPHEAIMTMGIMLGDDDRGMGKGPLHRAHHHSGRPDTTNTHIDAATPTISNSKRGKVFQSCYPPPLSATEPDAGYPLCRACPTGEASPAKQVNGRDNRAIAEAPPPPTADDYAILFFDKSPEQGGSMSSRHAELSRIGVDQATAAAGPEAIATPHKRKRRRISFGASIPIIHLLDDTPQAHAMTDDERSVLWFSRPDLEVFKCCAQLCIQDVRERVKNNKRPVKDRNGFRAQMVAMEDETGSSIRGLEHRVFRRKQSRRSLIQDVLECQSHVKGLAKFGHAMAVEERLSLLAKTSADRSAKAQIAARLDARDDCLEVYGEDAKAGKDGAVDALRTLKRRKRHSGLISL